MNHTQFFLRLPALLVATGALCALSGRAGAATTSIGVDFGTPSTVVASTDSAGVTGFAQTHWQAVTATPTNLALTDNTGAATTAKLTISGVVGFNGLGVTPSGTDEVLNRGQVSSGSNWSFTIDNIPYAGYSLLVYDLSFNTGLVQGVTVGGTTYYSSSPNPTGAGYIDNNAGTAFTYTQATSTLSASPTAGGDYMLFTGLSGTSLTVNIAKISGTGSGSVGAFQIIQTVPEPSTALLFAVSGATLLLRRRRAAAV